MQNKIASIRLGRSGKFLLSSRGSSTEAAYRAHVRVTRGSTRRLAFDGARAEWAQAHGLEPDDGVYLSELSSGSLTLEQLGEGLAVCSQTREMISAALVRLISGGFVEQLTRGQTERNGPTHETAHEELVMAENDLVVARCDVGGGNAGGGRMITEPLRQAVFRVVAARRFRDSFSPRG